MFKSDCYKKEKHIFFNNSLYNCNKTPIPWHFLNWLLWLVKTFQHLFPGFYAVNAQNSILLLLKKFSELKKCNKILFNLRLIWLLQWIKNLFKCKSYRMVCQLTRSKSAKLPSGDSPMFCRQFWSVSEERKTDHRNRGCDCQGGYVMQNKSNYS